LKSLGLGIGDYTTFAKCLSVFHFHSVFFPVPNFAHLSPQTRYISLPIVIAVLYQYNLETLIYLHLIAIISYMFILIVNGQRHENAIRYEPRPHYRTEAVLDGFQICHTHPLISITYNYLLI